MDDFIFIEIISFYIVLQTLNVSSKTGPPRIVNFKNKKVVVFNKIENSPYLKIMHLCITVAKTSFYF